MVRIFSLRGNFDATQRFFTLACGMLTLFGLSDVRQYTFAHETIAVGGSGSDIAGTVQVGGLQAERWQFNQNVGSGGIHFGNISGGNYTIDAATGVINQASGRLFDTPTETGFLTTQLNFDRDGNGASDNWNTLFPTGGNQERFQVAWTGYFVPDVSGNYTFESRGRNNGGSPDDNGSIFIDSGQDGSFSGDGNASGGGVSITRNLTAGQKYQVAYGFNENGGGDHFSGRVQGPGGSIWASETYANPSMNAAGAGFYVDQIAPIDRSGEDLVVSGGPGTATYTTNSTVTFDDLHFTDNAATTTLVKNGAGTLSFANGNTGDAFNTLGSNNVLQINDGTVQMVTGSNPMGMGSLTLNGGTFQVDGVASVTNFLGDIAGRAYEGNGAAGNDVRTNNINALLGGGASYTATQTSGSLDMGNDAAIQSFFGVSNPALDNNYRATWTSVFTPDVTGVYNFHGRVDDDAGIWVDYNQNSTFETGGSLGNERVAQRGCCGTFSGNSVSLTAGQNYNVAWGMFENGGGAYLNELRITGPGGSVLNNTTVEGNLSVIGLGPVDMTATPIHVTDNSGLVGNSSATVAFGTINIDGGKKLTLGGENAGVTIASLGLGVGATMASGIDYSANATLAGNATFEQSAGTGTLTGLSVPGGSTVSKTGAGTLDVTVPTTTSQSWNAAEGILRLSGVVSGANPLVKTGNGTMELANGGNNYTGKTVITDGIVLVRNGGALGGNAFGQHTEISNQGTLKLIGNLTTNENISISGNGNGGGEDAAIVSQSGTVNIDGKVTTTGNTRIRVSAPGSGRLRLRGGLEANNNIRFYIQGSGEKLEITAPITGGGQLTFEGDGTTFIRANSPGYSGNIRLNNGVIDVDNRPTGLGNGGTLYIDGDATLRVHSNVNLAKNIRLDGGANSGNGQQEGRLWSSANNNTLSGNIAWNTNSRVDVNNNSTLNLTGVVSGSGAINKTDNGRLVITNGGNTHSGAVNVQDGTVAFQNAGSFSGSSANVSSGGTLELSNTGSSSAAVSLSGTGHSGAGAVHNVAGANSFSGALSIPSSATINSNAGSSLNFTGPVNIGMTASATFNGAGDVTVQQAFGNGNTAGPVSNSLSHYGFHINNDNLALNLHNNAGMMGGGDPTTFNNFYGVSLLTSGPGGRGLDFNNDTDFKNTGSINQNDNYSNLWVGTLTADVSGTWSLRNAGDDDRAGHWFDIDQDGTFESSQSGLGSNRGEQLSWENGGWKDVTLTAGEEYLVGFTHREGGGGSRADFRFRRPGGPELIIKPADGAQAGLWSSFHEVTPDSSVVINSTGVTRFNGDNNYNGTTDVNFGTLIVNGTTSDQGDYNVASGATLGGHGTIDAIVNISDSPGIVSPGDQAFANIGTTWSGDPTYSAGTTLETVGTLTFSELNLGGILQLDVLADGADQIAATGDINLGPLSQLRLGIDGTSYDPSSPDFELIDFEALGFEEDDVFELIAGDSNGMFENMLGLEPFVDASGNLLVEFTGGNGSPFSLQFSAAVVPEPGAILIWSMMGMGLCGYGYRRRRNRLASQSK